MKRFTRLTQTGDTLVEVLIAMVIVSSVLGSAFVVVNRSTQNVRQAQEREEALGLLQGQVERMKVAAKDPTKQSSIFGASSKFCVNSLGNIVAATDSSCAQGTNSDYKLSIERQSANLFQFYANWDGPTGLNEQANIVYELYQ